MSDRELIEQVQRDAGRAMTRLNKLRVGENVRQQQLLAEAKDYLGQVLDAVQFAEDQLDDLRCEAEATDWAVSRSGGFDPEAGW